MDKEDIENLANDPKFIPGIYNYCDRWCERCSFTSRCLNFAIDEERFSDPQAHDISNEIFWQKLSGIFELTLDMLQDFAESEGIDLDSIDIEAETQQEKLNKETAQNHACVRAAKAYSEMVGSWFDSAEDLFKDKEDELNLKVRLAIAGTEPHKESVTVEDAVQVIRWYQHQIYVKLMRAVHGKLAEESDITDDFPRDSDGSAKVALIAIDRSIASWAESRNNFPERESDILDILVHLDRLRRKTEKYFPDARAFIRPGFDEQVQQE